jgi:hypothetical protein
MKIYLLLSTSKICCEFLYKIPHEAFFRWEKDGRQSQAACWLVFLGRHGKAIDILMRSKGLAVLRLGVWHMLI